ncbi:MAG: type II toxin-antitoxin system RelB/DinJ family antitoxin [Clostridia bacterium]|nr:type II toxin-antitoxin system RelB/DinJ family antitoxin [Clostridia bacterium]
MAQTLVNIRMDEELKKNMDEICKELGITMSAAFNMFAKKMTREKRIPFDVSISDIKKENSEVGQLSVNDEDVIYLTQNGYNPKVVMSLEKYFKMTEEKELNKSIEKMFGNVDIEKELEEAEEAIDNPNTKYLTHEEIFAKARRLIDAKK